MELNSPPRAAASAVEALAYQLRDGVKALRDPSTLRRIAELSEPQMREIAKRLTKRVPPWQADEINIFIKIWGTSNGNS